MQVAQQNKRQIMEFHLNYEYVDVQKKLNEPACLGSVDCQILEKSEQLKVIKSAMKEEGKGGRAEHIDVIVKQENNLSLFSSYWEVNQNILLL